MEQRIKEIIFEKIRFINGNYKTIKKRFVRGGVMVVPAAPALKNIHQDKLYYKALKNSSFAILDSGYLCLLLRIIKNIEVTKFSGLKFLRSFFKDKENLKKKIFLIDPSREESIKNKKLLNKIGVKKKLSQYIAPIYNTKNIVDKKLLLIIKSQKPRFIIINLGGGKQEILANYLNSNLNYKFSIFCTGAAISFLTGSQAKIPKWIDYFYLGWLMRCLVSPIEYTKRYSKAFGLINLVIKSKIKIIK